MSAPASASDIADVVIVGSGVAGALVASELAASGARVRMLEAGGRLQRPVLVDRMRNTWRRDVSAPYPRLTHASVPGGAGADSYLVQRGPDPFQVDYLRAVGGTTWHWSAMSPRFLPSDFEMRARFGVARNWPIGYADLEPWYLRAEHELGVAGDDGDDLGSPRSGPYPMPAIAMPYSDRQVGEALASSGLAVKVMPAARNSRAFDGRPQCCGNNTCTPLCPIGASYSADVHVARAERAGAMLTENAVAYRIEIGADARVSAVHYKTPDGESHVARGRCFVIACNGIETPRLLLMSRSEKAPRGVANFSDQVGRNLMNHPEIGVRMLTTAPMYVGRGPNVVSFIDHARDGAFRARRAAAKIVVLNVAELHETAVRMIESEEDWAGAGDRLREYATHSLAINAAFEQLPEPGNRVQLADDAVDGLGLARPAISYEFGDYIRASVPVMRQLFDRIIAALGARRVRDLELADIFVSHIMGTTRMGNDPADSVVDGECRAHDHPNLFVAGSSLFPTSSTSNPTLTLAALSLRLADTVKSSLRD